MNLSTLNSNALNSAPRYGNNAVLAGGILAMCLLSSSSVVGAVLSSGITGQSLISAKFETRIKGGVECTNSVGGGQKMTTNLMYGIYSVTEVGGLQGFEPSLRYGVSSPSFFGGQLRTHMYLQSEDTVGFASNVGGNLLRSDALYGGVSSTAYMGGGMNGSTVLASDGVKSSSKVGGLMKGVKFALSGGVTNASTLGGAWHYNAILSGGFLNTHLVGKDIKIEILMKEGVFSIGEFESPVMNISPVLNYGLSSNMLFGAKIKISPNNNGGFEQTNTLNGKYKIYAKLQGGFESASKIEGKGITASQWLKGGSSSSSTVNAKLFTKIPLSGGMYSNPILGGDIAMGFLDPLLNTRALEIRSATVKLEILTPIKDI